MTIRRLIGVSFLGMGKSIPMLLRDWDGELMTTPRTHRNEFPAGYSSASCTPALLASASSASFILQPKPPFGNPKSANGYLSLISLPQAKGALQGHRGGTESGGAA
jgi:hypothetical protein